MQPPAAGCAHRPLPARTIVKHIERNDRSRACGGAQGWIVGDTKIPLEQVNGWPFNHLEPISAGWMVHQGPFDPYA